MNASLPFLILALWAPPQDPEPGQVTSSVSFGDSGQYSYSCYLPVDYTPTQNWPILYCFGGIDFVEYYREVCEQVGWIVVALNEGIQDLEQAPIVKSWWDDTRSRFSVDPIRAYATGFSIGSRIAWWMASDPLFDPQAFRGIISVGAVVDVFGAWPQPQVDVWLMCGESDPARPEFEDVKITLDAEGRRNELTLFPGGHQMPDKSLGCKAVQWLNQTTGPCASGSFGSGGGGDDDDGSSSPCSASTGRVETEDRWLLLILTLAFVFVRRRSRM